MQLIDLNLFLRTHTFPFPLDLAPKVTGKVQKVYAGCLDTVFIDLRKEKKPPDQSQKYQQMRDDVNRTKCDATQLENSAHWCGFGKRSMSVSNPTLSTSV